MLRFAARPMARAAGQRRLVIGRALSERVGKVEPQAVVTREVEMKNYALAAGLLCFTGGVYYYVMTTMKQLDDLAELEEEGKINLHESGLKVTKPPRSGRDALSLAQKE